VANSILESFEYFYHSPQIIKIDPYNFELYRFKVESFFETQCMHSVNVSSVADVCVGPCGCLDRNANKRAIEI